MIGVLVLLVAIMAGFVTAVARGYFIASFGRWGRSDFWLRFFDCLFSMMLTGFAALLIYVCAFLIGIGQ